MPFVQITPGGLIQRTGSVIKLVRGCCRLIVTDFVITGQITICSSTVDFPSPDPLEAQAVNTPDCTTCNQLTCTASALIEAETACPDSGDMTGTIFFNAAIQCLGGDSGWSVHIGAGGLAHCGCGSASLGSDTWEQIVDDPEDLPGTYLASGDFSAFSQPALSWSATLTIIREESCRCPCRFMSFEASLDYTNCFGFSDNISWSGSLDWEKSFCCETGSNEACFSSDPDPHGFVASFCVNRSNVCAGDTPWQILTSNIGGICGFGTSQDIANPPGTYDITDSSGKLHWIITLSCSEAEV